MAGTNCVLKDATFGALDTSILALEYFYWFSNGGFEGASAPVQIRLGRGIVSRQDKAIFILAAGFVFLGALAGAFALGGYRVNFTLSYPRGLWQIVALDRPITVGDRVFICLPAGPEVDVALGRGYLLDGLCPSGVAPLIKTVVALAGQDVRVEGSVIVDGVPLPDSRVAARDGAGRPMRRWAGGTIPVDYVFVFSDFVASYDSRYFGPAPATGILGLARPVLTLAP